MSEKILVSGSFFFLAALPLAAIDDLERSSDVVKTDGNAGVNAETRDAVKKPAKKLKGKKANYVFEKRDQTDYKFSESGDPMKGKDKKKQPAKKGKGKAKAKAKTKTKDMSKDYKNESKDAPFKTYKFDEEGNPVPEKTKKKKTGKEEKIDNSLELGNESKKVSVTE